MNAEVTRSGLCSMQVCVPSDWTDEQVSTWANTENPTGIASQWRIRRTGDPALQGFPERAQCESHADNVHIMLDC